MPDDDDRPRDASSAAGAGWSDPEQVNTAWTEEAAPNDISELSRDIQAYHRELRAAHRRAWIRRLTDRPGSTPLLLIIAAMAIAALVATLLTLMHPSEANQAPSQLPLAHTSIAAGQPNGLLPSASLRTTSGSTVDARNLRPGVIALIPLHCQCTARLRDLASDASRERLRLSVIAPSYPDAEAASLPGQLDRADSAVLYDPTDQLRTSMAAEGLTLVVVDRDGTVYNVQRNVVSAPASNLSTLLQRMLLQTRASG
jgi:hypothetical protein